MIRMGIGSGSRGRGLAVPTRARGRRTGAWEGSCMDCRLRRRQVLCVGRTLRSSVSASGLACAAASTERPASTRAPRPPSALHPHPPRFASASHQYSETVFSCCPWMWTLARRLIVRLHHGLGGCWRAVDGAQLCNERPGRVRVVRVRRDSDTLWLAVYVSTN